MNNQSPTADARLLNGLIDAVDDHTRLEGLTDRELVFEVLHSDAAEHPAVAEMMSRLWPDWTQAECPPNCWACRQENNGPWLITGVPK